MEVIADRAAARSRSREWRASGKRVALVPTMGCLHAGHMSLLRAAGELADAVVCSIYLNETQFGPGEDFSSYPRRLEEDLRALRELGGVHCVFAPSALFPSGTGVGGAGGGQQTFVTVERLQRPLCGRDRPAFFRGVATVVAKLLNILEPDVLVLGRKDFQQYRVIERMVEELDFPVRVVACPTVREHDGLAMSSRNLRLRDADRAKARRISVMLTEITTEIKDALRRAGRVDGIDKMLDDRGRALEADTGGTVQYLESMDGESLEPRTSFAVPGPDGERPSLLIATAVVLGGVRLIDNVVIETEGDG